MTAGLWFSVLSLPFGRGSRVEGRGSRVEGRGSRVEGRGSRVEGRGSRVEGRGSKNSSQILHKFFTIIFERCQNKISYRCLLEFPCPFYWVIKVLTSLQDSCRTQMSKF